MSLAFTYPSSAATNLLKQALEIRSRAYAPYSQFLVGAAILCADGEIICGCNVENASYGATVCAERAAACTAISMDQRDWIAIAVASVGGVTPCGICRQFLAEFNPHLPILLIDVESGKEQQFTIEQLLPSQFSRRQLPSQQPTSQRM